MPSPYGPGRGASLRQAGVRQWCHPHYVWHCEGVKASEATSALPSASACTFAGSFGSHGPIAGNSIETIGVTPGPSAVSRYFVPFPCRGGDAG